MSRAVARWNRTQPERAIRQELLHSGQHYDRTMSSLFFPELGLPEPSHHLGVGSGAHGGQTAQILQRLEKVLTASRPDVVLVFGDTNTTLAGALAAAKLQIPVAHVEAGLRSHRRNMPEEVNRLVADQVASALYCPSSLARRNLAAEGITDGVEVTGDVMHDALLWQLDRIDHRTPPLTGVAVAAGDYALATVHRAENTDDPDRLHGILRGLAALARSGLPVVMPLHPRTRKALGEWSPPPGVQVLEPLSFEEMLVAESRARVIVTDSGGVQKEAYWLGVPCVTVRDETEWAELVETGWNTLVGADPDRLVAAATAPRPDGERPSVYGSGDAADRIVASLATRATRR